MTDAITYPARPLNGGPWHQAARFPKPGTWRYEPKYNGWRALIHTPSGTIYNRKGEVLSIAKEFATALATLKELNIADWLDCEALERRHGLMRGCLIVLDVVAPGLTYDQRRAMLNRVRQLEGFEEIMPENTVWSAPSFSADQCEDAWSILQKRNELLKCEFYEGLVGKRADSTYPIQLRSPDYEFPGWIKMRWHF